MARSRLNRKKVKAALKECKGFVSHTANKLGCNRESLYRLFREFPEMKEYQQECVEARGDDIILAQYNRACGTKATGYDKKGEPIVYDLPPDPGAAKVCLTYNHNYAEKVKNEHTGADGNELVINHIVAGFENLGTMPDYAKKKK